MIVKSVGASIIFIGDIKVWCSYLYFAVSSSDLKTPNSHKTYETKSDSNINHKHTDLDILETNLRVNLSQMSDPWIAQLHQAAMLADNDLIFGLIKDIPTNNTVLTHSLISLMDNFCYNQIMYITNQALEKK